MRFFAERLEANQFDFAQFKQEFLYRVRAARLPASWSLQPARYRVRALLGARHKILSAGQVSDRRVQRDR
jgi:hypothetical protein